jgi:probable aminopeptidase NPEPL1
MLSATQLTFGTFDDESLSPAQTQATVIIGKKEPIQNVLSSGTITGLQDEACLNALVASVDGGTGSATTLLSVAPQHYHRVTIGLLPDKVSRNNHPLSVHKITEMVAAACASDSSQTTRLMLVGVSPTCSPAVLTCAIAKALPLYSRKSQTTSERRVHVAFVEEDSGAVVTLLKDCEAVAHAVRLAADLVDRTPEELTTDAYAEEVQRIVQELVADGASVTMTQMVGEELNEKGYGGLYGVGKAATCPPRFIEVTYTPTRPATQKVALVGKGIVYDTGGLSLKPKEGMGGMKMDMGGSAGLLGAFYAAVKLQTPVHLTLVLCLAENAIGPKAFRNDDILTLYSGKAVEVNNCDAEGRLVLGDGVAHVTKHIENLDLVVDMATLTGAQLVATGKKHAAILANQEELERRAVAAGLRSGDLCYPILYAPELLKQEFNSKVADMKNSVKDRSNAQTSCAGHFIEAHLAEDYKGGWIHIDMAGPAWKDDRGTGYGVGLVLSLLGAPGF